MKLENDTISASSEAENKEPVSRQRTRKVNTPKNVTNYKGDNGHVITGDNNKVDVNGDIINKGIEQRTLTNETLTRIIQRIPAKSTHIIIQHYEDKECHTYASQIYHNLKNNGFTNIETSSMIGLNCFDGGIRYQITESTLSIIVCSKSNTVSND